MQPAGQSEVHASSGFDEALSDTKLAPIPVRHIFVAGNSSNNGNIDQDYERFAKAVR
jgi:hypothetical protein